jgi:hypothetical protein
MSKRTSPTLVKPSAGDLEIGEDIRYTARASVKQSAEENQYISGNKCGHNTFFLKSYNRPQAHNPRPAVLEYTINAIDKAKTQPDKFFKTVNYDKNGRLKRTEIREAINCTAQAIAHYMDMVSREMGFLTEQNKFKRFDRKFIARIAGISLFRVKEAIKHLTNAGYMESERQYKKGEKNKSLPSLRRLLWPFFRDLGVSASKFNLERHYKLRKQAKELKRNSFAFVKKIPNKNETIYSKSDIARIEAKKAILGKALEIHKRNPDIPLGSILPKLIDSS